MTQATRNDEPIAGGTLADGAWSHPEPEHAAAEIADRIAFDPKARVTA